MTLQIYTFFRIRKTNRNKTFVQGGRLPTALPARNQEGTGETTPRDGHRPQRPRNKLIALHPLNHGRIRPPARSTSGRGTSPYNGATHRRKPIHGRNDDKSPSTHDRQPRPHRGRGAGGRGGKHTNPRQARDPQQGGGRAQRDRPQAAGEAGEDATIFYRRRADAPPRWGRGRDSPKPHTSPTPTKVMIHRHPARTRTRGQGSPSARVACRQH